MPNAAPEYRGQRQAPRPKPSTHASGRRLYNDRRWQRESRAFILASPKCYLCHEPIEVVEGRPVNACVDHEPAHRGDERAFWCKATWRVAHSPCHSRKTARKER